ncbi:hypothetical protein EW146_g1178 [Bondarzewia mesenterica]|uniref:Uncharacterized protein n=1 Tax=Bondarzewia mesenterica TaxID=1095465 RepID=A0A4S4M6Y9_9AGAM|nr:hypothetical protein EW146_g1178 [Bondarzewia mesenterica]
MDSDGVAAASATDFSAITAHAHAQAKLAAWFSLQIVGGQVLMPLLVATFVLSKTARRDPTLVNLCGTFILTGFCGCLLLYAGKATGPEPSKGLCAFQAAVIVAGPPTWSIALLSLVFQTWNALDTDITKRPLTRPWKIAMIIAPYAVFLLWTIITASVRTPPPYPKSATRSRGCIPMNTHPLSLISPHEQRKLKGEPKNLHFPSTNAVSLVVTVTCIVIILFAGPSYCATIPPHKRIFTDSELIDPWFPFDNKQFLGLARIDWTCQKADLNVRLAVRLFLFMVYLFGGTVLSVWSIFDGHLDVTGRDMFVATSKRIPSITEFKPLMLSPLCHILERAVPTAVFIVFGTQTDVFHTWRSWLWRRGHSDTEQTLTDSLDDMDSKLESPVIVIGNPEP